MVLKNKIYTINLDNCNNKKLINRIYLNKDFLPIPCVDKSIPQKCIGFMDDSTFTINRNKYYNITISGNFKFFDSKEYELIGCEISNKDYALTALIFKEKEI